VKLPLLGGLVAALALSAVGCASEDPSPLVAPPPITAADGTVIPLPPNVADGATDAQRDAYADQVLAFEHIDGQRDNGRAACAIMDSGSPAIGAITSESPARPRHYLVLAARASAAVMGLHADSRSHAR
jgi:hypothetical protein